MFDLDLGIIKLCAKNWCVTHGTKRGPQLELVQYWTNEKLLLQPHPLRSVLQGEWDEFSESDMETQHEEAQEESDGHSGSEDGTSSHDEDEEEEEDEDNDDDDDEDETWEYFRILYIAFVKRQTIYVFLESDSYFTRDIL